MHDFTIREAGPNDIAFIYATWLNSYRDDGYTAFGTRNIVFFPNYTKVIDRILAKPETKVLIAHVKDEPNVLLGYMVFEDKIIHYTFCKRTFQGFGIANALMREAFSDPDAKIICTANTRLAIDVFKKKLNLTYNPFLLFQT